MARKQKRWKPDVRYSMPQSGFKVEVRMRTVLEELFDRLAKGFEEVVEQTMREVVAEDVLPYLEAEYFSKNFREYSPIFVNNKGVEFNTYDFGNYDQGFADLGRELRKISFSKGGSGANKGIGFRLGGNAGRISISNYTAFPRSGTTEWDSWFLAVELGTGIASNIASGSPNLSGATKYTPPGAWIFGPQTNKTAARPPGALFHGQKGFNIFWENGNANRPNDFWLKLFNERIPMRLHQRLTPFLTGN